MPCNPPVEAAGAFPLKISSSDGLDAGAAKILSSDGRLELAAEVGLKMLSSVGCAIIYFVNKL